MKESALHRRIYDRSHDLPAYVLRGPGDDCAVLAPGWADAAETAAGAAGAPVAGGAGHLLTVDQLIESRHFHGPLGVGTPLDAIARKAVARSVSDIAAMAGRPRWGLATAALPAGTTQETADALFDRLAHWARHWGCPLVGGDVASTAGPAVLTVAVGGAAPAGRGAVLRSGARPGDSVYVTGRIGGAFASGRHLRFTPRVDEGAWLAEHLGEDLHAMIDVSDGLGRDAGRVAEASGVRIVLDGPAVVLHADAIDWRAAIGDGEDYELLFTAAPGATLPARIPTTDTRLTRIGRVEGGSGCVVLDERGEARDASDDGWDHRA